jgi:hypothetical protein
VVATKNLASESSFIAPKNDFSNWKLKLDSTAIYNAKVNPPWTKKLNGKYSGEKRGTRIKQTDPNVNESS